MTLGVPGRSRGQRPAAFSALLLLSTVAAVLQATAPQQTPTFRSGVDYVAVDVQVVDRDGRPMPRLNADQFEVSIAGKRRRVVTADFVRNAETERAAESIQKGVFAANGAAFERMGGGRVFMMAIDENSFTVGESRGVVGAVGGFINELQPTDLVGVYSYPLGPKIQPTTDHAALIRRLQAIVGNKRTIRSDFHLSPIEVVDITSQLAKTTSQAFAETAGLSLAPSPIEETLRDVQARECGLSDQRCLESIQGEAIALAFDYENRANQSLHGLRTLVRGMSGYEGRKTVVVLSGGMLVSDRPGGRPDVGELPKVLGQEAAQSNIAIYAVHVDNSFLDTVDARTSSAPFVPSNRTREADALSRIMSDFSGASGGAFIQVGVGSGESALDRVVRETSAHYLLAVEPTDSDRDGKLRELSVKVNQKGATVRSRSWVVIPRRG